MKDIPTYNVKIDKEDFSQDGIFTVSVVNKPAIQSNFIYMSEEEKQHLYKLASEEKQEVVGAVLIPNKPIYRKDEEGNEFYIQFSEETIEDMVYKMSKDGFFNYFNVNHSNGTDGVFMLEYWIKEDKEDKSNKYGFQDLPVGTLFMKCKIEDDAVWDGIKNGELNGFSIEAKTKLELLEMAETNKEDLKSVVKELLAEMQSEDKDDKSGLSALKLMQVEKSVLSKLTGDKDGSYTLYIDVYDGEPTWAWMESHHYQDIIALREQEVENTSNKETKLEENDETREESVKEVSGETSTELSETEESKSEEVELNENPTEDTKEETVEMESKEDSKDEEIELSEEEAEKVLLSEQTESNEDSTKESKPVYLERSNPNFSRKFNSWVANLYQNN